MSVYLGHGVTTVALNSVKTPNNPGLNYMTLVTISLFAIKNWSIWNRKNLFRAGLSRCCWACGRISVRGPWPETIQIHTRLLICNWVQQSLFFGWL